MRTRNRKADTRGGGHTCPQCGGVTEVRVTQRVDHRTSRHGLRLGQDFPGPVGSVGRRRRCIDWRYEFETLEQPISYEPWPGIQSVIKLIAELRTARGAAKVAVFERLERELAYMRRSPAEKAAERDKRARRAKLQAELRAELNAEDAERRHTDRVIEESWPEKEAYR
jgi:hypothetical protein